MTNVLRFIGVGLILAAKPAFAFQPTPQAQAQAAARSIISSRERKSNNQRIGSLALHQSSFDDDEDSGYEIRGDNANAPARRPETTFGAENVPVEQRPSNEYLNLINAPTFGWASQESGDIGLILRLTVLYGVLYYFV